MARREELSSLADELSQAILTCNRIQTLAGAADRNDIKDRALDFMHYCSAQHRLIFSVLSVTEEEDNV